MKVLKHFWWVATHKAKAIGCKHRLAETASCPYTGLTYTTCIRCLKRIRVEKTWPNNTKV